MSKLTVNVRDILTVWSAERVMCVTTRAGTKHTIEFADAEEASATHDALADALTTDPQTQLRNVVNIGETTIGPRS